MFAPENIDAIWLLLNWPIENAAARSSMVAGNCESTLSPVNGVKQIFEKTDPSLANNQLIFPSSSFTKNCSVAPSLKGGEETRVTEAFQNLITG